MAVEEIGSIEALSPELGIEVEASGGETAPTEDLVHGQAHFLDRVGELVGVPAVLRITPVGVDAPEDAVVDRVGDLVVKAVAGQGGVVDLDVDEQLAEQVVPLQEPVHGGAVVVVLMLGRFLRFRLDQEGSLKAD